MSIVKRTCLGITFCLFTALSFSQNPSTGIKDACWRLKSVKRPNNDTLVVVPVTIHSNLRFTDSLYNGTTGVNSFLGKYDLGNDSLLFIYPRTTLISAPSHYRIERFLYEELLNGKAKFELKEQTLILRSRRNYEFQYVIDADKRHCVSKLR